MFSCYSKSPKYQSAIALNVIFIDVELEKHCEAFGGSAAIYTDSIQTDCNLFSSLAVSLYNKLP